MYNVYILQLGVMRVIRCEKKPYLYTFEEAVGVARFYDEQGFTIEIRPAK